MATTITEKKCPKCTSTKNINMFFKMKSAKSGYASLCKECCKKSCKKYHDKKKGLIEEEVKPDNDYQQIITTNFKVCEECKVNKMYKCFVAIDNQIMNRRNICRDCESNKRKNLESKTKHCPQCNTTYDKSEFPSDTSRIDGLYGLCRNCKSIQDAEYKKNNPEKVKELNKKRMENPQNKIAHSLRTRLQHLIKDKQKHTFEYLGLSKDELKAWFEYQFDEKMNWNNYGTYWQIDHVVPCASFDLTKEEEIHKCCIWTNLRPLEKKLNNSKNNKILDDEISDHKKIVEKYKKSLEKPNELEI